MVESDENVMGAMIFDRARQEIPYLQRADIGVIYTPREGEERQLEYWPADEPGAPDSPRPQSLPMGRAGVQVFSPNVRPADILGEYLSHNPGADPRVGEAYQQFQQSITPEQLERLRGQYETYPAMPGEERPEFEEWRERSGVPAYFRGYLLNQWGSDADPFHQQAYTPEQIQQFNALRQYLGYRGQ